eukprot:scaffold18744_cov81-Cyclotella_meneghiniana.AAC.6
MMTLSKRKKTAMNGSGASSTDGGFPPQLLKSLPLNSGTAETIIPNAMFVMRNALTSSECKAWIAYSEENDGKKWDVVSHPATKYIAHRE